MKLRVWAPKPKAVSVEIANQRLPMARAGNGYWELDTPLAKGGSDYAFILDGGDPVPDPRSAFQPSGVHGPSRIIDHSLFKWSDCQWNAPPLSGAIVYELHTGTFTAAGTFDAAIERLDYLADLGITHVELMPVAEFSGVRGWGYDGVGIFAPH